MRLYRRVLVCTLLGMASAPVIGFAASANTPAARAPSSPTISIRPGKVQTIPVVAVSRVAIGNPEVADVTIVAPDEVMIQARKVGTTNLLIWDDKGKREIAIAVVDSKTPEIRDSIVALLGDSPEFQHVRVEVQDEKVFLVGDVDTDASLETLEHLTQGFEDVINLVKVSAEPSQLAPLVQLSVRVIELTRSDLDSLGVDWNDSIGLAEEQMPAASLKDTLLRVGQSTQRTELSAILTALFKDNKARLLSEPRLVTVSGKEANSFVGVEIPFLKTSSVGTGTGTVSLTIEYRQVGVILKMTPYVHTVHEDQRGKITTALHAEVSAVNTTDGLDVPVGNATVLVPAFDVRKADTEVTTSSGDTIFIAGLLKTEESETMEGVPGLGKIPILGRLFRSPSVTHEKTELVVTITPELVAEREKEEAYREALKQARSYSTTVSVPSSDPYVSYVRQVQQHIASAIQYPDREKSEKVSGNVKLRLHVLKDGRLQDTQLVGSSGNDAFDLAVVKAVQSQAPFAPFPSSITEKELWFDVPVAFRP